MPISPEAQTILSQLSPERRTSIRTKLADALSSGQLNGDQIGRAATALRSLAEIDQPPEKFAALEKPPASATLPLSTFAEPIKQVASSAYQTGREYLQKSPLGLSGLPKTVESGVMSGLKGLVTTPIEMMTPTSGTELAAFLAGGPAALTTYKTLAPSAQAAQRSVEAFQKGRTLEGAAEAGKAVPLAGPFVSHFAEMLGQRKYGEALGEAAVATIAGKIAPSIGKTAETAIGGWLTRAKLKGVETAKGDITKVLHPGPEDYRFEANRDLAVGDILREAKAAKTDVKTVADLQALSKSAKDSLLKAKRQYLGPVEESAVIPASELADAVRGTITKKMRVRDPSRVRRIQDYARRIEARETISLKEVDEFLTESNIELRPFYQRSRLKQITAKEQKTAKTDIAVRDAAANALYTAIERVAGKGVADIQRRIGAQIHLEQYLDPLVLELKRYGTTGVQKAAEIASKSAAIPVYSKGGLAVRAGRGLLEYFQKGPDEVVADAFKKLKAAQLETEIPRPNPPKRLALPAGPVPSQPDILAGQEVPPPRQGRPTIPAPPVPPGPSYARGFQAPFGVVPGELPGQKLLPGTGGTTPLEHFLQQRTQESPGRRSTAPYGAMQPRQLPPGPPGVMRETVQTPVHQGGYRFAGNVSTPMMEQPQAARFRVYQELYNKAPNGELLRTAYRLVKDSNPEIAREIEMLMQARGVTP